MDVNTPILLILNDVTKESSTWLKTLETLIGLGGWFIAVLIGIVAYYYKRNSTSIDDSIKALDGTVKALDKTVTTLNAAIEVLKLRVENQLTGCVLKHKPIEENLLHHEERLGELEEKFVEMEKGMIRVEMGKELSTKKTTKN